MSIHIKNKNRRVWSFGVLLKALESCDVQINGDEGAAGAAVATFQCFFATFQCFYNDFLIATFQCFFRNFPVLFRNFPVL